MAKRRHKAANGFDLAVSYFGGIPQLAKVLTSKTGEPGINRQSIYLWNGVIPKFRAIEIESLTNGQLSRHVLRPDLFPKDQAA